MSITELAPGSTGLAAVDAGAIDRLAATLVAAMPTQGLPASLPQGLPAAVPQGLPTPQSLPATAPPGLPAVAPQGLPAAVPSPLPPAPVPGATPTPGAAVASLPSGTATPALAAPAAATSIPNPGAVAPSLPTSGAALSAVPGVVIPGFAPPSASLTNADVTGFPVSVAPGVPGWLHAPGTPAWDPPALNLDGAQLPRLFETSPVPAPVPTTTSRDYYFTAPAARTSAAGTPTSPSPAPSAGRRIFDVRDVRNDFPILRERVNGRPLVWLDNAATTQKPQAVLDRLAHYYTHEYSNVHRAAHTLAARSTDAYEGARAKVQRFLGAASASEIVFVRGTTEAVNLVANTWGRRHVGEGDEIVLTTLEHHSNIVPWQFLAQSTGAVLRVVPVSDRGEVLLDEYEKLLGERTKLVAVTHVSNALGTVVPVREMAAMAHRWNARVLVDGAQAVSHFPVNVQLIDADFYTLSGHKLFAPTGVGVLYGKRALLDEMPPWQGGGNMIDRVTFERSTFAAPPARFEAGTATLADAVGLGAAIDYLEQLGMENVARHEQELLAHATEALRCIPGLHLIGTAPEKAGVVSFVTDDIPPEDMGRILDRDGIAVRSGHHCAQPTMDRFGVTGTVRPSLALYNTHDEVDLLARSVRRALQR